VSASGTAESTDASATGEEAGDGDGDSTSSDDASSGPLLDIEMTGGPTATDEGGTEGTTPPWLVTMSRLEEDGDVYLVHVDIETAESDPVCVLVDSLTQEPITSVGPSLTFTRDDRLIASFSGRIAEISLPSCEVIEIGSIGYGEVFGILPDEGNELYGISSTSDVLLRIDTATGAGTVVGALSQDWFLAGATWIEESQDIIGLRGIDNSLYDVDQLTGVDSLIAVLDVQFTNIGIEYHPLTEQLYACTGDGHLYRIEDDFTTTDLGDMGLFGACTNLGAPWSDVVLPID
jgi:hypothetical protein